MIVCELSQYDCPLLKLFMQVSEAHVCSMGVLQMSVNKAVWTILHIYPRDDISITITELALKHLHWTFALFFHPAMIGIEKSISLKVSTCAVKQWVSWWHLKGSIYTDLLYRRHHLWLFGNGTCSSAFYIFTSMCQSPGSPFLVGCSVLHLSDHGVVDWWPCGPFGKRYSIISLTLCVTDLLSNHFLWST